MPQEPQTGQGMVYRPPDSPWKPRACTSLGVFSPGHWSARLFPHSWLCSLFHVRSPKPGVTQAFPQGWSTPSPRETETRLRAMASASIHPLQLLPFTQNISAPCLHFFLGEKRRKTSFGGPQETQDSSNYTDDRGQQVPLAKGMEEGGDGGMQSGERPGGRTDNQRKPVSFASKAPSHPYQPHAPGAGQAQTPQSNPRTSPKLWAGCGAHGPQHLQQQTDG